MHRFFYVCMSLLLIHGVASAEEVPNTDDSINSTDSFKVKELREDFLVPNSPAFAIMGLSPEEVITPTTPQELATALLNGIDANGNFQSGVAMDFSPYLMLVGRDLTLYDYRHNRAARILSRTQLSFAITKGAEEADKSSRLALGMRVAILDSADPRGDDRLTACYDRENDLLETERTNLQRSIAVHRQNIRKTNDRIKTLENQPNLPVSEIEELRQLRTDLNNLASSLEEKLAEQANLKSRRQDYLQQNWLTCNTEMEERNWNASNITVGLAHVWVSEDGNLGQLDGRGFAAYLSAAYGFEGIPGLDDRFHLIGSVTYRTNETIPDPNSTGQFFEQDTLVGGLQLRVAGPDMGEKKGGRDLAFFFEYDFIKNMPHDSPDETTNRWALGADFKISEGFTLNLSLGDETGGEMQSGGSFVISNLNWSF
ncbi:hypothetical protein [Emcibacter sp.]|uniref:hypothetical protein n=1 Tax=Emcibacter sp. TaxID=1979954 RepID=UPI003A930D3E